MPNSFPPRCPVNQGFTVIVIDCSHVLKQTYVSFQPSNPFEPVAVFIDFENPSKTYLVDVIYIILIMTMRKHFITIDTSMFHEKTEIFYNAIELELVNPCYRRQGCSHFHDDKGSRPVSVLSLLDCQLY